MPLALIVDDHPAICFALKAMLEKDGLFEVESAGDGIRAMAVVKEKAPDLLVLDISLARMDGMEILTRVKQYNPAIKVLILTGQPAEIYAPRTLRAGADGFLSKDYDLARIAPICQQILDGYCCFPAFCLKALSCDTGGDDQHNLLNKLSDREMAVLRYLLEGKTNKEIADLLLLSNKTISTYKTRLFEKTGTNDINKLKELLLHTEGDALPAGSVAE